MSFRTILRTTSKRILFNNPKTYYCAKILISTTPNLNFYTSKCYNHKHLKCWQCGIERKNIGELFCDQCNFIQKPPDKSNYFKIFEINEEFDIDQKQLTQKYRQLQRQLHPDKFTNKTDLERDISEEFSSLVNNAYNTLQTPLKRALHLLHLRGQTIEEGQKVEDPDFLMEIMELNEEVEDADTPEKLKKLKEKNDSELAEIGTEIKTCFDNNEIEKAKQAIIKLKYYNSVNNHINTLMREKGIVD